jgi:hypothetical protein
VGVKEKKLLPYFPSYLNKYIYLFVVDVATEKRASKIKKDENFVIREKNSLVFIFISEINMQLDGNEIELA